MSCDNRNAAADLTDTATLFDSSLVGYSSIAGRLAKPTCGATLSRSLMKKDVDGRRLSEYRGPAFPVADITDRHFEVIQRGASTILARLVCICQERKWKLRVVVNQSFESPTGLCELTFVTQSRTYALLLSFTQRRVVAGCSRMPSRWSGHTAQRP